MFGAGASGDGSRDGAGAGLAAPGACGAARGRASSADLLQFGRDEGLVFAHEVVELLGARLDEPEALLEVCGHGGRADAGRNPLEEPAARFGTVQVLAFGLEVFLALEFGDDGRAGGRRAMPPPP